MQNLSSETQPLALFEGKDFLTVSQLNELIRSVINMGFPQAIWLCGEVQGYDRNKSKKHVFFELCEKDPQTKDILARIGLVIFSNRKEHIEQVLKSAENAFTLKDDIQVKFLCRIDFYPPYGTMRLIVESIDPVYTLGKIAQEKQKIIAALKEKGILDKNKQIPLPLVPLNLGLITAYDSAAYNDFIDELKKSGFSFKVFLRNTLMQGKGAEADVCRALRRLRRIKALDLIVITRGGGSLADLSCFDSQKIAEHIASLNLPVLSGIGHEINITVTDLAAHTYQKTPTAVAQFIVQLVKSFLAEIEAKGLGIVNHAQENILVEKRHLQALAEDLQTQTGHFLRLREQMIQRFSLIVRQQPFKLFKNFSLYIFQQRDFIEKMSRMTFKNLRDRLASYQRVMEVVHPDKTLRRGFSITRDDKGKLIRSVNDLGNQQKIKTCVSDGLIESRVEGIKKT